MFRLVMLTVALLLSGCGDSSNTPAISDIKSIKVDVNSSKIYSTDTAQMSAIAYFDTDRSQIDITSAILYDSSNTTIATVTDSGVISGVSGGGVVEIHGWYRGLGDSATLDVVALKEIQITTDELNISTQSYVQLSSTGSFEDNYTADISSHVSWSIVESPDESNLSLEQNGTLYSGDKNGTITIRATRYDINNTIELYVK